MPKHWYREDRNHSYECDITGKLCDFPEEQGLHVCAVCQHYLDWKNKNKWKTFHK
jgi:hypothetical protein